MENRNAAFIHSVKMPRLYKAAAKVLAAVRNGEGSVKNIVFNRPKKLHPNVKGLIALAGEASRRRTQLDTILSSTGIRSREPTLDPDLARILVVELLFGKGRLPEGEDQAKPIRTILKYEQELREAAESGNNHERIRQPRYVRLNPLVADPEETLAGLEGEEVTLERPSDFMRTATNLGEIEFVRDPHVDNLVAFAHGTDFHTHPAYLEGKLLLQDRASCLPVQALCLRQGSYVLDACAAPGMKTTQIAAAVGESGRVIAVERDAKRYGCLREMIRVAGASEIVRPINVDFLRVDPAEHADIEYIVLDPSCSGSGMLDRDEGAAPNKDRLGKLARLQTVLLRHALSFPNVKKVSYSTCSIYAEENEEVVKEILADPVLGSEFKLKKCLKDWNRRGLEEYSFGNKVLRALPAEDKCNGFFVAVFQRRKAKMCDTSEPKAKKSKNER